MVEEFHWTPEEVDSMDPAEFDMVSYALGIQTELKRQKYERELAQLRK